MTINDLIKEVESLDEWDVQKHFDKDYDGGCPCFWSRRKVDGRMIEIHGHCWRTTGDGIRGSCNCAYNGLHVTGKLPRKDLMKIARAFKKKLDKQEWYSPYDLVVKSTLKR